MHSFDSVHVKIAIELKLRAENGANASALCLEHNDGVLNSVDRSIF